MLDKKISDLLNHQVNEEFYSSYLYLHFSNYYMEKGLAGFANWFRVQSQEELDHAMLFIQYLQNNNSVICLESIRNPQITFPDTSAPLAASLAHEQSVTKHIYSIYEETASAKDFRTMQFLDWFIKEQGEEENSAETLIQKMTLFASDPKGLYLLDQELGGRVYAAPTLVL